MAVFQAVPVWTGCEWALLIDVSSRSERQRLRPLTLLQDSYADFLPPHILISSWHQRRCCFIIVFPPEEKIICHFLGNYQEIAEPENKQWLILTLNVSGWLMSRRLRTRSVLIGFLYFSKRRRSVFTPAENKEKWFHQYFYSLNLHLLSLYININIFIYLYLK